jgi:hypothetical protein
MKKGVLVILLLGVLILLSSCVAKTIKQECPDIKCPTVTCSDADTPTVTKYVCENKSIVDDASKCTSIYTPPEFTPIKTNEEGSYIGTVDVSPSCIGGYNGVKIYFKALTIPDKVEFQVREGDNFETKYIETGITSGYRYIAFCEGCHEGDFSIPADKLYLLKLKFDFTTTFGEEQYSNEHLIDANVGSEYTAKKCSS